VGSINLDGIKKTAENLINFREELIKAAGELGRVQKRIDMLFVEIGDLSNEKIEISNRMDDLADKLNQMEKGGQIQ